ncbi:hypothetical protein D3C72_2253330 [compost metagenome]
MSVTLAAITAIFCDTAGGEVGIRKPRLIIAMFLYRLTTPLLPKLLHDSPVSALTAIMVPSMVGARMRRGHSMPAASGAGLFFARPAFTSQYATPRQIMCW